MLSKKGENEMLNFPPNLTQSFVFNFVPYHRRRKKNPNKKIFFKIKLDILLFQYLFSLCVGETNANI